MRPLLGVFLLVAGSACAPAAPPPPSPASTAPVPAAVDCGTIQDALCRSVADAAEQMTGTPALGVINLPVPSAGGMQVEELYVVTLEPEVGTAPSFVEVVRFAGSDNWSARRVKSGIAD